MIFFSPRLRRRLEGCDALCGMDAAAGRVLLAPGAVPARGGWTRQLKYAADYDLFLRMALQGNAAYVPKAFSAFRRHPGQKSISGAADVSRGEGESADPGGSRECGTLLSSRRFVARGTHQRFAGGSASPSECGGGQTSRAGTRRAGLRNLLAAVGGVSPGVGALRGDASRRMTSARVQMSEHIDESEDGGGMSVRLRSLLRNWLCRSSTRRQVLSLRLSAQVPLRSSRLPSPGARPGGTPERSLSVPVGPGGDDAVRPALLLSRRVVVPAARADQARAACGRRLQRYDDQRLERPGARRVRGLPAAASDLPGILSVGGDLKRLPSSTAASFRCRACM